MIKKKLFEFLKTKEFISVATCDFQGRPNVAPKFLLKTHENALYLVDYVVGKSYRNLKINPRACLSVMNTDELTGYQVHGSVELIEGGKEHKSLYQEFLDKEISLSTKRVIEGVGRGETHRSFELSFAEKVVIFRITIEEVVEIHLSGELKRQKTCEM